MEHKNGSLWKKNELVVVLQELTTDLFCLLQITDHGLELVTDHENKWQYAKDELPELMKDWVPAEGVFSVAAPKLPFDEAEAVRAKKTETEAEVIKTVKKKVRQGKV